MVSKPTGSAGTLAVVFSSQCVPLSSVSRPVTGVSVQFDGLASMIVAVPVRLPELPVIVIGTGIGIAFTVEKVTVLGVFAVAVVGLKTAVTPLGRVEVLKVTLPSKPKNASTVITSDPLAPGAIAAPVPELVSTKLGVSAPTKSLIRFCPFGLPQPVTSS